MNSSNTPLLQLEISAQLIEDLILKEAIRAEQLRCQNPRSKAKLCAMFKKACAQKMMELPAKRDR